MDKATCSIDGCDKPLRAKGYCAGHYHRWSRTGDAGSAELRVGRPPVAPTECSVNDCGREAKARGLCKMHWKRWRMTGDPGQPESFIRTDCSVQDCSERHHARGFCSRHAAAHARHGDPLHEGPGRGTPGSAHPKWLGDDAGYEAAHQRLHKARGSASVHRCVSCPEPAKEWAYNHTDPLVKTESAGNYAGSPYSLDPDRYQPMCVRCHRNFDVAHRTP